jgi:toxin FitB
MSDVVVDTNIASLMFKGTMPAALEARLGLQHTRISWVTFAEMIKWSEKRSWGIREYGRLVDWLTLRTVAECDRAVWFLYGRLSARAELRGRPQSADDTWIAACCISYGLPLVTRNVKHFVDFAEHEGLQLIEV